MRSRYIDAGSIEFTNLEKFVWEGLNRIGRSISEIDNNLYNPDHEESRNKPRWHDKTELDEFVSGEINLRLEDYGWIEARIRSTRPSQMRSETCARLECS